MSLSILTLTAASFAAAKQPNIVWYVRCVALQLVVDATCAVAGEVATGTLDAQPHMQTTAEIDASVRAPRDRTRLHAPVLSLLTLPSSHCHHAQPRFLTDDQDQMLGASFPEKDGVGPMPQTKRDMQFKGSMATNFFIHTPICCPSRSELITGMYFHNIKAMPGTKACMHTDSNYVNNNTFAKPLSEAGYKVGTFACLQFVASASSRAYVHVSSSF